MAKAKTEKRITFASKLAMANALEVNRTTIHTWTAKEGFPGGTHGPWKLGEIIRWLISRQSSRPEADDPALDGPTSPALERYRAARASLAELELNEKQGTLINREAARDSMSKWGTLLRGAGETLRLRHGADAQRVLDDALDDCERIVSTTLGSSSDWEPNQAVGSDRT